VFPHLRAHAETSESQQGFAKAQFMIQTPSLLASAVSAIDKLPLTSGDHKGDLYEYLLSKLSTAGINGQFRTPRHIIGLMATLMDPTPNERIADPACGTGGFLVGVMNYWMARYSSPEGTLTQDDGSTQYTGDLLTPYRDHLASEALTGFDFDATMLRIARMNLLLHNIDAPRVYRQNTLSTSLTERFPAEARDHYDVILANPPFKGHLDYPDTHPELLRSVKTKKTELLFLALILQMLRNGGRSATIVPDGVLFGSSGAHKEIRRQLCEEHQLEGVISMPSGVFKPYAGVSTAILLFTKGGQTEHVWFYDMQADGYSLDDKRDKIDANDIPDVIKQWKERDPSQQSDRKAKAFCVPLQEIIDNKYDLSINRYKEIEYEEVVYEPPKVILQKLRTLEDEIRSDLDALEGMLG
jgi:type I restriction enzyme M protein